MMLAILIVEDDALLALDLEGLVSELGHRVCATAATADEAVEAASTYHPDLILMDFNLAGHADGAQAAHRIRLGNEVPIVFVTAQANTTCRASMECVSRSRIVSKPYQSYMIANAILEIQAA